MSPCWQPNAPHQVIQLYEMIVVRHGLMLVGPTGGGKSSNLHVLEETLTRLKQLGAEVSSVPVMNHAPRGSMHEVQDEVDVVHGRIFSKAKEELLAFNRWDVNASGGAGAGAGDGSRTKRATSFESSFSC